MQGKGVSPRAFLVVGLGIACIAALAVAGPLISVFSPRERSARSASRPDRPNSAVEISLNTHDFGAVLQSEMELTHRFPIVNRGEWPVDLRVARVACGCLEITCPSRLSPGEASYCEARLTLGGREGPLDVAAHIETSEPGAPVISLLVRCEIVPDLRVDPPHLEFTDVKANDPLSTECRVITAATAGPDDAPSVMECTTPCAGVVVESLGTSHPGGLLNRLERTVHRFRVQIDTRQIEKQGDRAWLPNALIFQQRRGGRGVPLAVPVSVSFRHHNHLLGSTMLTLRRGHEGQVLTLKSIDGIPFNVTSAHATSNKILMETGDANPSVVQSLRVRLRESPEISAREKSIAPVAQTVQKCALTIVADQWPGEPYEVDVLLLP